MNRFRLFVRRAIALFVVTSLLPLPALAQVIASPSAGNANRPNVSQTANGLPIVNIATPNAAGVSSNLYQQYNVGSQGLILNNAQGNTQTQLAGYVAGNPYLASGSARIILNQVVSGSASQLRGYTEVAGQQAQVVVANPAGIFCNGCGFINTSRSVLTTGTPIFGGSGSLDAFRVTGGQIQIGANGLNGSNIDQVDLIARSVQINGKLWANRALNVVAGANDVQYADLSATALTPDSNRPAVAIDVGALGGMYAGKIALIGTEAGVGVNSAGMIEAQAGDLQLSSQGKVTISGVTSATGNINASGSSLNMTGAKVGAKGDATLIATAGGGDTGNIDLTGAALIAGGSLSVNAQGALSNDQAQTSAARVSVNAASVSNRGGMLSQTGTGDMTLTASGALDNTGGTITSNAQNVAIHSANLTNADGQISHAGTGTLDIRTGALDNTGGTITSNAQNVAIRSANLTNVNGQISHAGTGTLGIQSDTLNNSKGSIASSGTATATVADLDNTAGSLTVSRSLGITASDRVDNIGGKLSGANVQIGTTSLDNSSGLIGSFANATGDVAIAATTLKATNGQISASRDLVVTTNSLFGGGQYSAVNDLTLNLQGSFAASASDKFNAGHNLTFTLPGTFSNAGAFVVANGLTIHAGDIANSGLLNAGGLLTTSSRTLTNTGSIVGGSVSLTATQTLSNLGTRALIGATDSAGKLELLAPDIENRDDVTATDAAPSTTIYGLGQVVLAGSKDASGNYTNANLVRNQSALIQSGGNMQIAANQVTNTRRVMATGGFTSSVDPSVLDALGISMSGCTAMQIQACSGQAVGWTIAGDPTLIGGAYTQPPHGDQWNSGYQYTTYTGVAVANTVTSISPESQIISGGNLNAGSVGTFQNYWSKVAASGSIASPVTLDQNSWQGQSAPQVQVTYSGQYHYNNYDDSEHNWQLPFGDAPFVGSRPGGYTQAAPADVRTYALPAYESSFTAGTTLSGTGTTINNSAGNASIPSLGLQPGQTVTGQNGALDTANLANLKNPTVARATAGNVLTNLTLPKGGLFNTDTAPNAPYLVETNPAFTNQKQWLSSDYYFQQMGMNPGQIQLRLGDGFYEQKLVQDQIMSLTGKSVLTNYADTQAEFQALMTSGAQLAKSLDLAPGMGLSADQVAQLTSNVVIMQDQVVDGQTVLVPVVYLAQASQENMGNGPVIAATDIDLQNAKTVTNSGTIAASNNFSVSAQSIDSSFGTIQAGKQLALATTGDVNLTSATVNAGSLALQAGGDLILNTAANTVSQVSSTGATRVTTTLGPTASINVKGDATIVTGGDFQQNAGNLDVGGDLGMQIGGDWTLGAQQTGEHKVVERAGGVSDTDINQSVTSSVTVGGQSNVVITGDLTARGAQIDLGEGGTIAAKGNISLETASATTTVNSTSSGSSRSRSYSETLHRSDDAVTETTLKSGDSLAIVAGKDLNVIGSTVDLTKGAATLMAAGNVNIVAATETHVSELQGQGSHGGALSHTSQEDRVDQATQTADGSTISADSVSIVSGHDINVTGSNIVATNNVALGAKGSVNILAATDTYQDSEFHDVKHSGFSGTGGLGVSYGSSEQKDQYTANSVTQSQSRSTVVVCKAMCRSRRGRTSILAAATSSLGRRQAIRPARRAISQSKRRPSRSIRVRTLPTRTTSKTRIRAGFRLVSTARRSIRFATCRTRVRPATRTYNSKQSSAGFQASLCIPPICYGTTVSGSVNVSQQSIQDNFQSVVQQSGLYAGDGGFNVNVGNHTQLDGGVIASTADADKNSLSTQTFGYSNLQNSASDSGSSIGFSASGSGGASTPGGMSFPSPAKQAGLNGAGPLNSQGLGPSGFGAAGVSDNASGATYAAISAGTITVRGDAGTGQDSTAGLSRDTANANGFVKNTFDAQAMQDDMAVQQQTAQVGMQVAGDVASYLKKKADTDLNTAQKLLDKANESGDPDAIAQATVNRDAARFEASLWSNDGAGRIGLHAVVAGLGAALGGGNVTGALAGTVAGDIASHYADQAGDGQLGGTLLSNIAAGAAGALAGGALGGSGGALSGANGALGADLYNRQLHKDEKDAIHKEANGDDAYEKLLTEAACYRVQCWAQYSPNSAEWDANYVSDADAAQNLGQALKWVDSNTVAGGLFNYTFGQKVTDAAASALDEAVRGAQNIASKVVRDVTNFPHDLVTQGPGYSNAPQGDANPLIDVTIGGSGTPPTAGAVAVPAPCPVVGACGVAVTPVLMPGAPAMSSSNDGDGDSGRSDSSSPVASSGNPKDSQTSLVVPGRVQSRVNVTNADGALDHIVDRHLDPTVNASQFSIDEGDLIKLLQDPKTISTPVTRTVPSGDGVSYVREVDTGHVIGTDKFNGSQPTSVITVLTDKYGNLVTAFPGKLK